MKIIVITDHLKAGGGVNSFVFDLVKTLFQDGQDVYLIGLISSSEKLDEVKALETIGVPVFKIDAKTKLNAITMNIPRLRSIIKRIAKGEKTVINVHLKLSVLMGAISSIGLKNVKCIETYHNTYHHYHLQCWSLSWIIRKYITVSNTARNEMHKRFFIPFKKIIAIPNGVNREEIIRKNTNIVKKEGILRIVTVGRFSPEKNIVKAVKALSDLKSIEFEYIVIGDGPTMLEAKQYAANNTRITLCGAMSRDKVYQHLAQADLLIMPSLWEGRSIVQLEAAAFDLPMIISDVPGLREPFNESPLNRYERFRICSFGYVVQTNDESAYRDAVSYHATHHDNWTKMRERVKSFSIDNDISTVAKKYMQVFNEVFL